MGEDRELYEKLGGMASDVSNVKTDVREIKEKVDTISESLNKLNGSSVKHSDCNARTDIVASKIDGLRDDLAKKKTREDNPALSAAWLHDQTPPPPPEPEKKTFSKIRENVVFISTVLGLVGIIVVGGIKFARFMVSVENMVKNEQSQSQSKLDDLKTQIRDKTTAPRIIYIYQDAGAPEPKKRRRRR